MNKDMFIEELKKINVNITQTQLEQLDKYYLLLVEWNKKINLTGIVEEEQVYLKHFYDSATISRVINLEKENSFCDIGTGAGFPGMVIKILFPNLKVTLVDSLNKRIKFLNEVKEKLGLENIEIYHDRAEDFARKNVENFDVVTARAVAKLPMLLEYSMPMLKKNKFFIAMKSNINEEITESKNAMKKLNCDISMIDEFNLPVENSLRTIIKIEKIDKTPTKYPRKNSEIKKNPL